MRKLCLKIGIINDLYQLSTHSEKKKTADDQLFLNLNTKKSNDEEMHELRLKYQVQLKKFISLSAIIPSTACHTLYNKNYKKMTKQILKAAALGILGGLALFAIPFFLLKAVIFILLIRIIFGFFGRRRFGPGAGPGFAFAGGWQMKQRFQNMTEEERNEFFAKMKHHGCGFSAKQNTESPSPESK